MCLFLTLPGFFLSPSVNAIKCNDSEREYNLLDFKIKSHLYYIFVRDFGIVGICHDQFLG